MKKNSADNLLIENDEKNKEKLTLNKVKTEKTETPEKKRKRT